jgi:hypothetical protein
MCVSVCVPHNHRQADLQCLFVCVRVCVCVCVSVCLSTRHSSRPSDCPSICLSVFSLVIPSAWLTTRLSVCLSVVRLSVRLSVCGNGKGRDKEALVLTLVNVVNELRRFHIRFKNLRPQNCGSQYLQMFTI